MTENEQMNDYTINELELAFHNYFKAKQKFLLIAKRFCEQERVDEGKNAELVTTPRQQSK